jgi:murein DD-endopeptidase MepM/ murein hydrolase activator NlpD
MIWPVVTTHPLRLVVAKAGSPGWENLTGGQRLRRFGAARSNGARKHVGVDLFAYAGDEIVAIADGVVIRNRGAYIRGVRPNGTRFVVRRVLVDHGPIGVVGYCEVAADDAPAEGTAVVAGQRVGVAGLMKRSAMLHFELQKPGAKVGCPPWRASGKRPPLLVDPSDLLVAIAAEERQRLTP